LFSAISFGGKGCPQQQEDLIPFSAIDEYRERVCGFAEVKGMDYLPVELGNSSGETEETGEVEKDKHCGYQIYARET
jgi:hypothetical protein